MGFLFPYFLLSCFPPNIYIVIYHCCNDQRLEKSIPVIFIFKLMLSSQTWLSLDSACPLPRGTLGST